MVVSARRPSSNLQDLADAPCVLCVVWRLANRAARSSAVCRVHRAGTRRRTCASSLEVRPLLVEFEACDQRGAAGGTGAAGERARRASTVHRPYRQSQHCSCTASNVHPYRQVPHRCSRHGSLCALGTSRGSGHSGLRGLSGSPRAGHASAARLESNCGSRRRAAPVRVYETHLHVHVHVHCMCTAITLHAAARPPRSASCSARRWAEASS